MRSHATSRGMRQSTPMTSPPARAKSERTPAVSVPKWITGTRAALDGIARERERRAGEANERDVRGKGTGREPHRVHHVREIGGWLDARQLEDLGRFMNRAGDVRSLAGREAEAEAEGLERQQDVGEENRGVHAQPLDRLEGDPGG